MSPLGGWRACAGKGLAGELNWRLEVLLLCLRWTLLQDAAEYWRQIGAYEAVGCNPPSPRK